MERDRGFNFKLLVPSWGSSGQVSAVRPLEMVESCGDFMNSLQQGHSKGFEKEQSVPFPITSMVTPTRPVSTPKHVSLLPIIVNIPQNNCSPGQLYSKLFDEVEKIKCWKVKADSDAVQRERKLQENKRTIETQRKAIQDLQFGNESLSVKLEEQISENEDLRNRNNGTRNLCNILKDTFQRSAEKMHLFESEREETHHLFMENSGSIKKMIASFESLRIQAEADQQELQKVREALLQFEDLKEKYHQEYKMKEKEVAVLQTKMKDKENELQQLLLDLHENQKQCKQLQEATNEQYELLKSSKQEQEFLLQRLNAAEQHCEETEVSVLRFFCAISGKSLILNLKPMRDARKRFVTIKLYIYSTWNSVIYCVIYNRGIIYFQNKMLKKQIAKENAKSSQFEMVINGLQEESQNLKRLKEEDHQKWLQDLESKSSFATELENELKQLRLTAVEAIKNKEDTELKCQHKIADMVALMEKHKSQYDRMVQEKDAELDEYKRNQMEAAASTKSLVADLTNNKAENDQLTKQLKTEITEKENMQKELTDLKKVISSTKCTQLSEARNKQSPASDYKQRCSKTPKDGSSKRHTFDFSEAKKTLSHSQTASKKKATLYQKEIHNEDLKTPTCSANRVGGTSKIKSYRIRTPPAAEKAALWGKGSIELDPKSDSSDQSDLLTFASATAPSFSAPQCKPNIFKKIQSPVAHKSPGNSLKLAAMKRMRDAGWTAVTGCDKKKRTTNEKIFA
uniref:Synaptonemal complex protein 1 n=1 Tax=Cyclopterus lumpus TaxID=8103 RepID=A0A8C3A166_CYCLU